MAEPLRHRQTKGAGTDMLSLTSPRHISTLPTPAVSCSAVLPSSLAIEPCVRRTCVLALTSRDFSPHLVGWLVLAEADVNSVA
jgi:hypothetical protein